MNRFLKYPLLLFIVGGVCAALISGTYFYTKPILDEKAKAEIEKNMNLLYDDIKSYEVIYTDEEIDIEGILNVYLLKLTSSDEVYVYETSNKGKNGEIVSLIAFKDDKIDKIVNVSHMETPGIGTKIDDPAYIDSITSQEIDNMNVDIISGATYSSSAMKNSVDSAILHYTTEVQK